MLRLETGMQANKHAAYRAFTLIEILVVLVIIGITLTFAILFFGNFGSDRRIHMAGQSFIQHVKLAQQQAILESVTYGVEVSPEGYQILKFGSDNAWHTLSQQGVFAYKKLPAKAAFNGNGSSKVVIVLNASGDMTPFSLNLKDQNNQMVMRITGSHDGQIRYAKS